MTVGEGALRRALRYSVSRRVEAGIAHASRCPRRRRARWRPSGASLGRWGLIVALAALPIYYGDPRPHSSAMPPGWSAGHAAIHHDLTRLGFNFVQGLSNGAIWALIAIGYTLVYGIIELINFAHGDVFMIGSFTGAGLLGDARAGPGHRAGRPARRTAGDAGGHHVRVRLAQRADRAGRLPAAARRAEARAADHRGRVLVHPPERRAAVAGRLAAGRRRPGPPGRRRCSTSPECRSCAGTSWRCG